MFFLQQGWSLNDKEEQFIVEQSWVIPIGLIFDVSMKFWFWMFLSDTPKKKILPIF